MKKEQGAVFDRMGNAIGSVSVTVYNHGTTQKPTIYSDNGITPQSNPFQTDSMGRWAFYVANGRYDIEFSGPRISTYKLEDVFIFETGVTDHGELTGLLDDDHTQYALLTGRSGGQSLYGGTGAGEVLIFSSTINSTKGKIVMDDGTQTQLRLAGNRANGLHNVQVGQIEFYNTNGSAAEVIGRIELVVQDNYARNGKLRFFTSCGGDEILGLSITDVGQVGVGVDQARTKFEVGGATLLTVKTDSPGSTNDAAIVFGEHSGPDYLVVRRTATGNNLAIDAWSGSQWKNRLTLLSASGKVGLNCSPEYGLDLVHEIIRLRSTDVNNTDKAGRMVVGHYDNSEEPAYIFGAYSGESDTWMAFGGGAGNFNAATQIDFYTASTNKTLVGVSRLRLQNDGIVNFMDSVLQFGTYVAKDSEAFAGYITIKDKNGNDRKVMVCV